jgi:hypothetical protein
VLADFARTCFRPIFERRVLTFLIGDIFFWRPFEGVIIEFVNDDWLDHGEIRRDVEIPRRIKTVLTNMIRLTLNEWRYAVTGVLDVFRQNRVMNRRERLCNKG